MAQPAPETLHGLQGMWPDAPAGLHEALGAPVSVGGLLGVVIGATWFVLWRMMEAHYAGERRTLRERVQLRDDQLARVEKDLTSTSDAETALAKALAELEKQRPLAAKEERNRVPSPTPRRITKEQRAHVAQAIAGEPSSVLVELIVGTPDGTAFARDLVSIFKDAQWQVRQYNVVTGLVQSPLGMELRFHLGSNPTPLIGALQRIGLEFDVNQMDEAEALRRAVPMALIVSPVIPPEPSGPVARWGP